MSDNLESKSNNKSSALINVLKKISILIVIIGALVLIAGVAIYIYGRQINNELIEQGIKNPTDGNLYKNIGMVGAFTGLLITMGGIVLVFMKKGKKMSNTMKNVAKLSTGTLAGQLISFITSPLCYRVFGAEYIGLWTLFHSYAGVVVAFSDLGMAKSIVVEKDPERVVTIYKVITTLSMCFSIISASVLTIFYMFNKDRLLGINIIFFFVYMIFDIFTRQQTQICYSWLNRNGKYNTLMKNPVISKIITAAVSIAIGLGGAAVGQDWLLMYGYFIGAQVGAIITLLHMRKQLPKALFTFKIKDFIDVIKSNKRYVQYQLPANLISQFKNQLPTFFIEAFFGAKILGYYSVSVKLIKIPINLLANAMGRVFFKTVSDMKRAGKELGGFVYKSLTKSMKIAVIPLSLVFAFGDIAIQILYGKDYDVAGNILRIVILQNYLVFIMTTVQGIAVTLEKQKNVMVSCIAQAVSIVAGMGIGKYVFDNIYLAVGIYSVLIIICNLAYFCSLLKSVNVSIKKYLANVGACAGAMFGIGLVLRLILLLLGVVHTI